MSSDQNLQEKLHVKPEIFETSTSKMLYFSLRDVQSKMHVQRPDELQFEYTKLMMGFLLHNPQPRSICMIGLGGGSLPKFCYRYLTRTDITVIEINPHVIAYRNDFLIPLDDHRFRIRLADAADFLKVTEQKFDVLIADGFDINGLPPQLSSRRFYDTCNAVLNTRGIFVANLHGCHRLFDVFLDRIQASFDGSLLTVNDPSASNRLVFSVKDDLHALGSLGNTRCPPGFDEMAWKELLPSMARVFLASKTPLHQGCTEH